MASAAPDSTMQDTAAVMCTRCLHLAAVPAGSATMNCPSCGTSFTFLRCRSCRWPLAMAAYNAHLPCPGCGARIQPGTPGLQSVQASELSYFLGLSAVDPRSSEAACHSACMVLGGWETPFPRGTLVSLATTSSQMHLTPIGTGGRPVSWPLSEVRGMRFGGPGMRVRGGGFWGGGFGLAGRPKGSSPRRCSTS